ncbi:peptidylprolyl isomerase [Ruminiclostridium cellulolyticum]|uniref:PpiC-type peptidyl-prolyl cis-trans isomerase n=1 Tax=Ruminiclostridium cellulolyticum (strain ATCC 35319 / DSM 5812 / JCM 6584 / H10) TaxID=394503 RepID=B8I7X2_RUMCH|nr:peptidylprolyl isomerase [Ruminiclostridium cellulolyticum]ACL75129.1 PpiC-type peptidyl-prolyl cis-trans isomerase [Ruminiclostridium cellulolyticum H10]
MYRKFVNALITVAMVLTSIIPASNTFAATAKTATPETHVAKVGTDKISKEEYNFFLRDAISMIQSYFNSYNVDWNAKINDMKASEYAKKIALDNIVDFKIQLSKAKDAKITLTKNEMDEFNGNMNSYLNSLASTTKDQENIIKNETGFTLAQFKSFYNNVYIVRKFASETQKKFNCTDTELKKYYNSNKNLFYKVVVGHILFLTTDENNQSTPKKEAEAKKKAEETLLKINSPNSDFAALVKELSEDPGSKETGGKYTVMNNNQFVPEFQNWAVNPSRKVGDTGIIKTSYGFHVMKLMKIYSFNQLKSDIKSSYIIKKYDDNLSAWRKDKKYKVVKNESVLNAIKVP